MCFSENKEAKNGCVHNAVFLAVKEATDIEKDKFSSIVGLGPKSDVGRMPSFIEQVAGLGGVGGEDDVAPIFSIFLTNKDQTNGAITFGGYDLPKYAQSGKTEGDVFWAEMAHAQTYFWVMNMGDIKFADGAKLEVDSKHMILDSGLTYALIPSEDFNKLTALLDTKYGVKCTAAEKKEGALAQVNPSSCTCKDYNALPELDLKLLQTKEDTKGKYFSMPRETYIQDKGNGTCKLLLNPNDMQIGARYGENYWIMGDQFMQKYYTIYDHKKWRVGLVESKNEFA
jgi:saccharopepsin